jgi:hypothetical protein
MGYEGSDQGCVYEKNYTLICIYSTFSYKVCCGTFVHFLSNHDNNLILRLHIAVYQINKTNQTVTTATR